MESAVMTLMEKRDLARTLIKGLDTITAVAGRSEGLSTVELMEALNESRSTMVRLTRTLESYGLIERLGPRWRTTSAFSQWAVQGRHALFTRLYRKVLEHIAAEVNELTLLGLWEGHGIVHLDFIECDLAVRVAPAPFTRHSLTRSAMGKLALSRNPALWTDEFPPAFIEQLKRIRDTGIAWNREESAPGLIALAMNGFGSAPTDGIIAVAWPAFRFTEGKGRQAVASIRNTLSKGLQETACRKNEEESPSPHS